LKKTSGLQFVGVVESIGLIKMAKSYDTNFSQIESLRAKVRLNLKKNRFFVSAEGFLPSP
jgi:hypothetical protein